MGSLIGRQDETGRLDGLIAAARRGEGGVLVLRGDPGIGKSVLLDHLPEAASGFRVIRASGSEFETDLPFAALHQMCVTVLDHLPELPTRLQDALAVAFGLATGEPDSFRIGLASLALLAAAAQGRPVLCLVDDAHWLDSASAKALAFVARRVAAEPVAVVFAARHGLDDLPGVTVGGLSDVDARALLARSRALLDEQVRDRVLAEAGGNPLALLELPGDGGFAPPDTSSVPSRVERGFHDRFLELPVATQRLLLIASADPTGSPDLLWAAAPGTATTDDTAGLVEFGTRVRFCHPLARSAVYRAATADQRRAAHKALAAATDPVTDPDRRAWHLAQASPGPDDDVAAELETSASRARARGGVAAAAAFLERAAALSLDPGKRIERTLAAVRARLDTGAADAAAELLTSVPESALDVRRRAEVEALRGQITFVRDPDGDGPTFMVRAATTLSGTDPAAARECLLDAVEMALVVGREKGVMDMVAAAAEPGADIDILDALVMLTIDGHKAAAPVLRSVFASELWQARPAFAAALATELWDAEAHERIVDWMVAAGRESGAPLLLRVGLGHAACAAVHGGDFGAAKAAIAEEEAIADAVGAPPFAYPRLHLAALRGRAQDIPESAVDAHTRVNLNWATAVLNNGLADYPAALEAARRATAHGALLLTGLALPELVEAAVRCGEHGAAETAADALYERTSASGSRWALGVAAYVRGLVLGAEEHYLEAIDQLTGSPAAPYKARAHLLYGEWLRRQGRRRDAREHLRTAHTELSEIGMEAFARRAADELRATGEQVNNLAPGAELTMQEIHIARLVATGATTKEVAARLFLSPRTIDAHLRNIFRKLGITSRRQLRNNCP
jgi:DNA-binding CsgD family transcriptional regulator